MVDFLVIGPFGCIIYSIVFPLIKDQEIRLGYNRVGEFCDGSKFGNINWFTTFDVDRQPFIEFTKIYDGSYKKFDNYNVINVDRIIDIPCDYYGVMGVPITFLEKWNPGQFEVIGIAHSGIGKYDSFIPYVDNQWKYPRILIRRK